MRSLSLLLPTLLAAQQPAIDQILERLDRLERENRELRDEVRQLRRQIAPAPPSPAAAPALEERLEVVERRVDEQAQTKVEATQRFPVRLSGMLIANLFHNGPHAATNDTPVTSSRAVTRRSGGFSFRQSILGLEFRAPDTFLGAQARGSVFLDFFDGLAETTNFYPVRVRTASIELDWKSRTLSFVQDKPLFSQRDPTTFSYFGVSPLTASGNLWRWQPQLRFEQRAGNGATRGRAQVALIQTSEEAGFDFAGARLPFERRRPGLEGRFEISTLWDGDRSAAVAPAFHLSQSHVNGAAFRSHLVSVDWLFRPSAFFEWSGLAWTGENIHHFGSLRQSFRLDPTRPGGVAPVESRGGWTQFRFPVTTRLSFNLYGGLHDDNNAQLAPAGIAANRSAAANLIYKVAPNVIVSLEALQNRTTYRDLGVRKNNRYDLSLAYLF